MKFYNIAGLNVGYESKYSQTLERSKPYLCKESGFADFCIKLDYSDFEKSLVQMPLMTAESLEYMRIGTAFYKGLLDYDGMMLHASAVVLDGKAYCFSAHSGTGKSTHTSLWLEHFADRNPFIINDDKPAIRFIDGSFYVYGTPFSGKHDISRNTRAPLQALCFIERSSENSIVRLKPQQVFSLLLNQTVRPKDEEKLDRLCSLIDKLLSQVPVYLLRCNISHEAAQLAYDEMSGSNENS